MFGGRYYTSSWQDPLASLKVRVVVADDQLEYTVPQNWNDAAVSILLHEIFYPAPIPVAIDKHANADMPAWLWPAVPATDTVTQRYQVENDIRAVIKRIAGGTTYHAWQQKYFATEEDAKIFYDEYCFILAEQLAAPDILHWQRVGLNWAYGIDETAPLENNTIVYTATTTKAYQRMVLAAEECALEDIEQQKICYVPIENSDAGRIIQWQREQDVNTTAIDMGRQLLQTAMHQVMDACDRDRLYGFEAKHNPALASTIKEVTAAGLPMAAAQMAIRYAMEGFEAIDLGSTPDEKNSRDYLSPVILFGEDAMAAVMTEQSILQYRGYQPVQNIPAAEVWRGLVEALWHSGIPTVGFQDRFTPSAVPTPSGTINLLSCYHTAADIEALTHVAKTMTVALSVFAHAQHPAVSLGMTNVATSLMGMGTAYDSDEGRSTVALLYALITASAWQVSAALASLKGKASQSAKLLETVRSYQKQLAGGSTSITAARLHLKSVAPALLSAVTASVDAAYQQARSDGFYLNAVTGGKTSLALQSLLNGQTTDIMPEAALARFESYFSGTLATAQLYGKKLNPAVPRALQTLGYSTLQQEDMHFYVLGHGTLLDAPEINHTSLRNKGFHQAALDAVEAALHNALHIRYAFNKWTLGADFCQHVLGFSAAELESGTFDMLAALGFSREAIDAANLYCCGTMTLEGAPHLKPEHLAVFDCAAPVKPYGVRRVTATAQIKMQAMVEQFTSHPLLHTVLLDYFSTQDDVDKLLRLAFEQGCKAVRLYREGASLQAPYIAELDNTATTAMNEGEIVWPKKLQTV